MAEFKRAAKVGEIAEGTGKTVTVGGRQVALFHLQEGYFAIDDMCPHRGGSLGKGELHGRAVLCPLHQWAFNVTNGKMPMGDGVESFRVRVERDEILIEI